MSDAESVNDHEPSSLPLATTSVAKAHQWHGLSANEYPISEDTWIASVVTPPTATRWKGWLARPRYRVCYDFSAWQVVVVAFIDDARGGALMRIVMADTQRFRTSAFAICRPTRRLFRLDRDLNPTLDAGYDRDLADLRYIPQSDEWDDPQRLSDWEALPTDRTAWRESQCGRSASSGLWRPELCCGHTALGGDFGWNEVVGQEPAISARARHETRQTSRNLETRERRLTRRALNHITREFRSDIVAVAKSSGVGHVFDSAVTYNWLCGAPSIEALTRRMQAIAAAPVLLPLLLQATPENETVSPATDEDDEGSNTRTPLEPPSSISGMPTIRAEIDRVVDSGLPLFEFLAQACSVSPRTVRHMRRSQLRYHTLRKLFAALTPPGSWGVVARQWLGVIAWLDTIAVEQWPQSICQWQIWAEFVRVATGTFECSLICFPNPRHIHDTLEVYRFAAACFRQEVASGWCHRADDPHLTPAHDHDTALMHIRELVRSINTVAISRGPEADADGDTDTELAHGDALAEDFDRNALAGLQAWTMPEWQVAGRAWHAAWMASTLPAGSADDDEADGANRAEADPDSGSGWLPLLGSDADSVDADHLALKLEARYQRRVRWLTSPEALAREGTAMGHCVASYTYECTHWREHIASVRDLTGARRSTLRIRLDFVNGQWVPVLVEHRATNNSAPNQDCVAAAHELMSALGTSDTSDLQARWVSLEAAREARAYAHQLHLNSSFGALESSADQGTLRA